MRKKLLLTMLMLCLPFIVRAAYDIFYKVDGTTLYFKAAESKPEGYTIMPDLSKSKYNNLYKTPWGNDNNTISKAILDLQGAEPANTDRWFDNLAQLESIEGLNTLNTSKVTSMVDMFKNCSKLKALDLSGFDTGNVTTMSGIFYKCLSLTHLDLHGFNTSKVTDLGSAFASCSGLTELDLSNFDTSSLTFMGSTFSGCTNLVVLHLDNFDTSKVDGSGAFQGTFRNCSSLKTIYCKYDWNNAKTTYTAFMYEGCGSLTGGKGTKVTDSSYKKYSRPDEPDKPGYFTLPLPKKTTWWKFDESSSTLYLRAATSQEEAGGEGFQEYSSDTWEYSNNVPWLKDWQIYTNIKHVDVNLSGVQLTNMV